MTRTDADAYYVAPKVGASLHERLARARQWDMEYGGYLSNHLAHNLVVMSAAGASEERLQWWQDLYTNRLDEKPAREAGDLDPARPRRKYEIVITQHNWRGHLSATRLDILAYRDFFDAQITGHGMAATVHDHLPALLPGLAGAALHPLIHTGWGVEAGSPDMVAEGLAYLATAHQPLGTDERHRPPDPLWSTRASGPIDAALAFLTGARALGLSSIAREASQTPAYLHLKRGSFQPRLIAFDDPNLPLAAALNAAGPLGLPDLDKPLIGAIEEMTALMTAALRGSDNEFFVLHGLTSLHAVLVLLPRLEPLDQRLALAYWWRAAMATVIAQDFPGISETAGILAKWRTERSKPAAAEMSAQDRAWWRATLDKAMSSLDEHVPKAAYVLWRWNEWQAFHGATCELFRKAAENLIRPHPSGQLHQNLWISAPGSSAANTHTADSQ